MIANQARNLTYIQYIQGIDIQNLTTSAVNLGGCWYEWISPL